MDERRKILVGSNMYSYLTRNGIDKEMLQEVKPLEINKRKVLKPSYRDLEYKKKKRFNRF